MADGQPPRILVVEDDEATRQKIVRLLSEAGHVVRAEADGVAIEDASKAFLPDMALLETRLAQGPDGLAIARTLRRWMADIPILFVTAAAQLADRLAGFEAGGDDYLVKPFRDEELVVRVRAVLRRSGRCSSKVVAAGDVLVDRTTRRVVRAGASIELTTMEFELLGVFLRHPGRTFTKSELLRRVWGAQASDPNLVETRISSLRRKLDAHGPRLLHTRHGTGYVLEP